jgi:hypothetical protein
MARIRGIKPDFFKDEDISCLPYEARLFFAGLWCHADREGRLEYRPKRLKVEIMPFDNVDIEVLCSTLSNPKIAHRPDKKFIVIYEVAEQQYIQICNFKKHQRPHSLEKSSLIPSMDGAITVEEQFKNGHKPIDSETDGNSLNKDNNGLNNVKERAIDVPRTPVSCSLYLVSGDRDCNGSPAYDAGKQVFPEGFEPDRVNSDTPLPPLVQFRWDRVLEKYPHPRGIIKGRDKAVRIYVKNPSEWNRWDKNIDNYAVDVARQQKEHPDREVFLFNLDTFLTDGFRDFDVAPKEEPTGPAPPGMNMDWKKNAEREAAEAAQDRPKEIPRVVIA